MFMRTLPFCELPPLPLWQTDEWAKTLRQLGRDAAIEPLAGLGQVLVVSRKFGPFGTIRFASRGPIWTPTASVDDQIEALRSAKLDVVNPEAPNADVMRAAGFAQIIRSKQVAKLQTFDDVEDQLKHANGKWRNAVRQGIRKKLWVSHDPFNERQHSWIFHSDRRQQRKKGFRTLPPLLTNTYAIANPGHVVISQMWQGNAVIAAMVFLRHGMSATYHIGWTSDAGRKARAHHVILTSAAQELHRKGVAEIDLGIFNPAQPPGLARFKKGSGATVHNLGGTWVKFPLR